MSPVKPYDYQELNEHTAREHAGKFEEWIVEATTKVEDLGVLPLVHTYCVLIENRLFTYLDMMVRGITKPINPYSFNILTPPGKVECKFVPAPIYRVASDYPYVLVTTRPDWIASFSNFARPPRGVNPYAAGVYDRYRSDVLRGLDNDLSIWRATHDEPTPDRMLVYMSTALHQGLFPMGQQTKMLVPPKEGETDHEEVSVFLSAEARLPLEIGWMPDYGHSLQQHAVALREEKEDGPSAYSTISKKRKEDSEW